MDTPRLNTTRGKKELGIVRNSPIVSELQLELTTVLLTLLAELKPISCWEARSSTNDGFSVSIGVGLGSANGRIRNDQKKGGFSCLGQEKGQARASSLCSWPSASFVPCIYVFPFEGKISQTVLKHKTLMEAITMKVAVPRTQNPLPASPSRHTHLVQRCAKRRALGCEELLPGPAWLLLSNAGPPISPSL